MDESLKDLAESGVDNVGARGGGLVLSGRDGWLTSNGAISKTISSDIKGPRDQCFVDVTFTPMNLHLWQAFKHSMIFGCSSTPWDSLISLTLFSGMPFRSTEHWQRCKKKIIDLDRDTDSFKHHV